MPLSGQLHKMPVEGFEPVEYALRLDDDTYPLNAHLGQEISIHYGGAIICLNCARKTPKSYSQGYCFPCMRKLARCDMCILKPHLCHYHKGTCREPTWGEQHCMIQHYVYLANTGAVKVGITRANQAPTRWVDQGACQAMPVIATSTRKLAGDIEVLLANHIADKTNWREMLKGPATPVDLQQVWQDLQQTAGQPLDDLLDKHQEDIVVLDIPPVHLTYPVMAYPEKIRSQSLDKTPHVSGILQGIKGQYLLLDTGVMNIRKFSGYHVDVTLPGYK